MTITNINSQTLKNWLKNDEVILIDVREPLENASQNIKEAISIPLDVISAENLPRNEGKKLAIHCRSGKRSMVACNRLISQNPDLEIYNLDGGILAWINDGNECGINKKIMPLERQVQLVSGLFILSGSLLAHFINSSFIAIPAFFGAGLIFAALTGTCGLGMCLTRMPWNKNCKNIK
jgi:rhodanese-related sulfurtransferase